MASKLCEPRFTPWIGELYCDQTANRELSRSNELTPRTLLLGESHYDLPEAYSKTYTIEVVKKHGFERPIPFFKCIMETALGRDIDLINLSEAWQRLAFSNYVQHFADPNSKRPTPPQWQYAKKSFPLLLEKVSPELIIVFGKVNWDKLPNYGSGVYIEQDRNVEPTGWLYDGPGGTPVLATWVDHPSNAWRKFSWQDWQGRIEAARTWVAANIW